MSASHSASVFSARLHILVHQHATSLVPGFPGPHPLSGNFI